LGKFFIDSLVHSPEVLDYVVNLLGANRVALGTDYPFPLGELQPGELIHSMPYTQEKKEQLLSGSALEWLGLKKSDFAFKQTWDTNG
jgi:aminocarboxymuconate-semialdehyde decarboxylase